MRVKNRWIGKILALALLVSVLLAGCREAPVAVQREETSKVQLVEQEQTRQEAQSISSGNYAWMSRNSSCTTRFCREFFPGRRR